MPLKIFGYSEFFNRHFSKFQFPLSRLRKMITNKNYKFPQLQICDAIHKKHKILFQYKRFEK